MKLKESAKGMFLISFLFVLLPFCQLIQQWVYGDSLFATGLFPWAFCQRCLVIGVFGFFISLCFVPSGRPFARLSQKARLGMLVLGICFCIVGAMLSSDFGSSLLPSHWASILPLLAAGFLCLAGFLFAVLVLPESETLRKRACRPRPCKLLGANAACFLGLLVLGFVANGFCSSISDSLQNGFGTLEALVGLSLWLVCFLLLFAGEGLTVQHACTLFELLGVLAVGYLLWSLLDRCSLGLLTTLPLSFWVALLSLALFVSIAFLLFGILFARWKRSDCETEGSKDPSAGESWGGPAPLGESALGEELAPYGLSEREKEAVSLMLCGLTSDASAEKMGVKAATVRTYLQGSYKKMGVDSAEEARVLLFPGRFTGRDKELSGESGPCDGGGAAVSPLLGKNGLLGKLALYGRKHASLFALGTLLLLLLPHEQLFASESWRVSLLFSLSAGFGLILAGLVSECRAFRMATGGWLPCVTVVLIFTVGFAVLVLAPSCRTLLGPKGCSLVVSAFVGLVSFTLGLFLIKRPFGAGLEEKSRQAAFYVFPIIAFASFFSVVVWEILVIGALLLFLLCVLVGSHGPGVESEDGFRPSSSETALNEVALLVLFVTIGFVLEDTWRSATDDFTWWSQAAFLVVLVACGFVLARNLVYFALCCCVSVFASICLGLGVRAALVLLLACLLFLLLCKRGGFVSSRSVALACIGLGGGVAAFRLLSDFWWDAMSRGSVSASIHGGEWLLGALMPALDLFLLVVGALSFFFLVSQRCESPVGEIGSKQADSIALYLRSRGLTELEVEVLLGIVRGATSAKIASESHYALGSVNSARWSAYRKLGIHSRSDLVSLLESNGFSLDGRLRPEYR